MQRRLNYDRRGSAAGFLCEGDVREGTASSELWTIRLRHVEYLHRRTAHVRRERGRSS